jgi:hypothetical protein
MPPYVPTIPDFQMTGVRPDSPDTPQAPMTEQPYVAPTTPLVMAQNPGLGQPTSQNANAVSVQGQSNLARLSYRVAANQGMNRGGRR